MAGMRNIRLDFNSPRPGDRQVMAGTGMIQLLKEYKPPPQQKKIDKKKKKYDSTDRQIFIFLKGINNHNTCQSLISYQSVVDCGTLRAGCAGSQWYCTRGTYKQVSGSCSGDSGGPSWTFRQGNIWKSITNSIYPNFRIYWDNSCCYS